LTHGRRKSDENIVFKKWEKGCDPQKKGLTQNNVTNKMQVWRT